MKRERATTLPRCPALGLVLDPVPEDLRGAAVDFAAAFGVKIARRESDARRGKTTRK